jgi:hypothetical protein
VPARNDAGRNERKGIVVKLELKTDGVDFVVSKPPTPKTDENGRQKADRNTGELHFVTELVAMDDDGAEVIKVTTLGDAPKVAKRQAVMPAGLRVTHWAMEGRSGLSFRADSIAPVQTPASVKGAA